MHGIANLLVVNGIMETEEQPPHRFAGANRHPSGGGELSCLGCVGKETAVVLSFSRTNDGNSSPSLGGVAADAGG